MPSKKTSEHADYLAGKNGIRLINIDQLTYADNLESLFSFIGEANYRFEQVDICDAGNIRRMPSNSWQQIRHVDRSIDGWLYDNQVVGQQCSKPAYGRDTVK